MKNRLGQTLSAWIACIAILFAALAPSVSHAYATSGGNGLWAQVCSASGTKLVKVDLGIDKGQSGHIKHCPFCSLHADLLDLPPSQSWSLPVPEGGETRPALFYQASRPLFAWASPQSRAPPQA